MLKNKIKVYWIAISAIFFISFLLTILNYRFGYFLIGGDAGALQIFPKISFMKMIYIWSSIGSGTLGGIHVLNLFPYLTFFLTLGYLGLASHFIMELYFFFILFISGLSSFLLVYNLLDSSSTTKIFGALASSFFYMLNGFTMLVFSSSLSNYVHVYMVLPILLYLYIKTLEQQKIKFIISFVVISIAGFSTNYAMVSMVFIVLFSYYLYSIFCKKDIAKKTFLSAILLGLTLLANLWWIIPAIIDALVVVESVAKNSTGWLEWMAARTSLLNLFRVDGYTGWPDFPYGSPFNSNIFLLLLGFGIPIFALSSIIWRKGRLIPLYFFALTLLGMFLAKSIHQPFSNLNQLLYNHVPLFIMFRSSYDKFAPMIVLGYSFLIGFSFVSLIDFFRKRKYKLFFIYLFIFVVVCAPILYAWPFWKGDIIRTRADDKTSFFVKIPPNYFLAQSWSNKSKLDYKILSLPLQNGYYRIYNWRYFGEIDSFLFSRSIVSKFSSDNDFKWFSKNNISKILEFYNIRNILYHADDNTPGEEKEKEVYKSFCEDNYIKPEIFFNDLEFYKISNNNFLPHFYTPKNNIITGKEVEDLPEIISVDDWEIRSAVFFESQQKSEISEGIRGSVSSKDLPVLEFKKINPTKYRIRVHNAKGQFPLVFSESFHDGWRAYVTQVDPNNFSRKLEGANGYKILDGNEGDQATKEEVEGFIENGWVTELPQQKSEISEGVEEKEIKHMKWNVEKQKEELDYIEKYNIDFISKNFQGTIQNDNLPAGKFWETWMASEMNDPSKNQRFLKGRAVELSEESHLMVNGYANSWVIDVDEVCSSKFPKKLEGASGGEFCIQNKDGTYDMELIVEFWPQRLFYIGVAISGTTLLCCLGYLVYGWRKRRKLEVANLKD